MQMKRIACLALVCCLLLGTIVTSARAAEATLQTEESDIATPLATNSFNISIPANSKVRANTSFSLMVGETITFKASYAPFSASLDIGFIAPDGKFYYFNVIGGSIDQTITVSQTGLYTVQFRNNSSSEVQISGFVNY